MKRFVMVMTAAMIGLSQLQAECGALPSGSRDLEFTYSVRVRHIPRQSKRLELWIPAPQEDARQTVTSLELNSPYQFRLITDPQYGNRAYYCDISAALPDSLPVVLTFQVRRLEAGPLRMTGSEADATGKLLKRFLEPDSLVPIDGPIAKEAYEAAGSLRANRKKARALYDHVLATVKYEKSGTGWGQGDAIFACTERRGNCSDIHSLLIGMARAVGIPARFTMGFPVPQGLDAGEITGYHCWADLYIDGEGWVPVDASEAIKNPDRTDYFFGKLDANRVAFTIGRDIHLDGETDSATVNYFIYPYVLLDGRPYHDVTRQFEFRESGSETKTQGNAGAKGNISP